MHNDLTDLNKDSAVNGATPFDQIAQLEAEQEALVESTMATLKAEEDAQLQKLEEQKKTAVTKERDTARAELHAFKDEEIPLIIKKHEAEAERMAKAVDAASGTKVPAIAKDLATTMLDASFITSL